LLYSCGWIEFFYEWYFLGVIIEKNFAQRRLDYPGGAGDHKGSPYGFGVLGD
jgi:hypothetical protein